MNYRPETTATVRPDSAAAAGDGSSDADDITGTAIPMPAVTNAATASGAAEEQGVPL